MSGRPVQLLAATAIAAAASLASISGASAGCYSGCGGYTYAAPVAYYSAPVVYSYSYAAPVTYAAPCSPCGYGSYGYASRPMYVVNQGPTFTDPVTLDAEPTPAYEGGYRRAYPWYSRGGMRWNRGYGYRGYGYRSHGHRFGLRSYGHRFGYRHHGYRYGAVVPGKRFAMRHPMVGPRGIYRGGMHHGGMHRMHGPRHHAGVPRQWKGAVPHHRMGRPGAVHPMGK
jgi:hypothetical protein